MKLEGVFGEVYLNKFLLFEFRYYYNGDLSLVNQVIRWLIGFWGFVSLALIIDGFVWGFSK